MGSSSHFTHTHTTPRIALIFCHTRGFREEVLITRLPTHSSWERGGAGRVGGWKGGRVGGSLSRTLLKQGRSSRSSRKRPEKTCQAKPRQNHQHLNLLPSTPLISRRSNKPYVSGMRSGGHPHPHTAPPPRLLEEPPPRKRGASGGRPRLSWEALWAGGGRSESERYNYRSPGVVEAV